MLTKSISYYLLLIIGFLPYLSYSQQENDSESKLVDSLCTVAKQYSQESFLKGYNKYEQILKQISEENRQVDIAYIFEQEANLMLRYEKNDSAILLYQKAIVIYNSINKPVQAAHNYNNLGLVYFNTSRYEMAIELFLKALKIYEQHNEFKNIGRSYSNLGNVFFYTNSKKAIEFYTKSLEIQHQFKDTFGLSDTYNNLATVYFYEEDYKECEKCFLKSLEYKEIIGDLENLATGYSNIGGLYSTIGENEKALPYLHKALNIYKSIDIKSGIAAAQMNLGTMYSQSNKIDSAIYYLKSALQISEENNFRDLKKATYENLAQTYSNIKKFDLAYEYLQKFLHLKDSLMDETTADRIQEISTKYETEKKNQQILMQQALIDKNTAESKQKTFQRNVLIAGLLIVLLFAIVLLRSYSRKRRDNKLLQIQKDEIESKNSILNQQKEEISAQRDEIEVQLGFSEKQRTLIAHQKKEIVDSINYAQRIQKAILPPDYFVEKLLGQHFILYFPKDVVSGDFYYIEKCNNQVIFAAVDCTGHGVPGSMMSVIGFNILNQAIKQNHITKPSEILSFLDSGITETLRQEGGESGVSDGMDIAVCTWDISTNQIQFAGAYNPMILIKDGELFEIKADKVPIGVNYDGVADIYTNHVFQLSKGDSVYLYSDGYADQFGGPLGKKFKYKPLKEIIKENHRLTLLEQKQILADKFNNWKGNLEQVDDVLIIGVRIS